MFHSTRLMQFMSQVCCRCNPWQGSSTKLKWWGLGQSMSPPYHVDTFALGLGWLRVSAEGNVVLVSPSSSRLGLPLSNPVIGCDQPYPGSQDRCNSYVPCRQSAVGSPCQRPHTYTIVILWSFNSIVVGWVLDNSLSKSRLDVGRGGCRVTVRY